MKKQKSKTKKRAWSRAAEKMAKAKNFTKMFVDSLKAAKKKK